MDKATKDALIRLVQDHKIQAGISLAVAMGVWHFKGHEGTRSPIHRVQDIIDLLKEQGRLLISDVDKILHFTESWPVSTKGTSDADLKWVTRVGYIGAVILLAATAIDIQHQIRKPDPELKAGGIKKMHYMGEPPEPTKSPW